MFLTFDTFEIGFNRLIAVLASLVAISIGLMALLVPLNLLLVKLQLGSLWWLFGTVEYALFFGVFAAAPWVLQQGAHVRVDVLTANIPENLAIKLDVFINLAGATICLVLCVYGIRAGIIEFVDMTMPDKDLRIANWIIVSFFSLSFLLSATEFLLRLRKIRIFELDAGKPTLEASF